MHPILMPGEHRALVSGARVPNSCRPVDRRRHDQAPIRAEFGVKDVVLVPGEDLQFLRELDQELAGTRFPGSIAAKHSIDSVTLLFRDSQVSNNSQFDSNLT